MIKKLHKILFAAILMLPQMVLAGNISVDGGEITDITTYATNSLKTAAAENLVLTGEWSSADFLTLRNAIKGTAIGKNASLISVAMENATFSEAVDLTSICQSCTALKSFTFPTTAQSFDVTLVNAFSGCTSLIFCNNVENIKPVKITTAFKSCGDLTSLVFSYLPGELTNMVQGCNPNLLIYLPKDVISVPTELSYGNKLLWNETEQMYQATAAIAFDDISTFWAPKGFMMGTYEMLYTYLPTGLLTEGQLKGWGTIALPFTPTSIQMGSDNVHISTSDADINTTNSIFLKSYAGLNNASTPGVSTAVFKKVGAMEANVPYIIGVIDAGTHSVTDGIKFRATGITIAATVLPTTTADGLTFIGDYTKTLVTDGDSTFGLETENGQTFNLVSSAAEGEQLVDPFRAYVLRSEGTPIQGDQIVVSPDDDVPTAVEDVKAEKETAQVAYGTTGAVVINAESNSTVAIYNALGAVVSNVNVVEGVNTISLPAGLYMVNGCKVVVK